MFYLALVLGAIEFISTMVMFKLFLYEEICQMGGMACFLSENGPVQTPISQISYLTRIHGINPGFEDLATYGSLAPWCKEVFRLFYTSANYSIEVYNLPKIEKE